MGEDDSWSSWSRYVVHELESNEEEHKEISNSVERLENRVITLEGRFNACLEMKAPKEKMIVDSRIGIMVGIIIDWVLQHVPKNP